MKCDAAYRQHTKVEVCSPVHDETKVKVYWTLKLSSFIFLVGLTVYYDPKLASFLTPIYTLINIIAHIREHHDSVSVFI